MAEKFVIHPTGAFHGESFSIQNDRAGGFQPREEKCSATLCPGPQPSGSLRLSPLIAGGFSDFSASSKEKRSAIA